MDWNNQQAQEQEQNAPAPQNAQPTSIPAPEAGDKRRTATKAVKKNVYQKLMAIQTVIKAPKTLYNSFGKYNYRNAESILEAVKPYLAEQECTLFMEDTIEVIGTEIAIKTTEQGEVRTEIPRRYVKATAHFVDCETGQEITTSALANECTHTGMSGDQCTGTASSYARKYCLNALFLLDDTKDSDTDEMKNIEDNATRRQQAQAQRKQQNASAPTSKQNNGGWGNRQQNASAPAPQQNNNNGGWGNNNTSAPPQDNGGWGTPPPPPPPPSQNGGWGN